MPQKSNSDKITYTKQKTSGRWVMTEENRGKNTEIEGERKRRGRKKRTKE